MPNGDSSHDRDILSSTAKRLDGQDSASCKENTTLNVAKIELASALHDGAYHIAERDFTQIQGEKDLCVDRPGPRKAGHPQD